MYCTILDVRTALTPGASEADPEKAATAAHLADWQIQDAIDEATGVVKMHVLSRYIVPEPNTEVVIDPNPDPPTMGTVALAPYPVRGWTRNIAAYLATLTFKQNQNLDEDDPIRLRFIMTMGMLEAVRDRTLDIPDLEVADLDDQGVHVENLYEGTLFGPEDFMLTPEGVVPSPNILWPVSGWNGP